MSIDGGTTYGLEHSDADLSSAEELAVFEAEKVNTIGTRWQEEVLANAQ